jgi:hypothetical protein
MVYSRDEEDEMEVGIVVHEWEIVEHEWEIVGHEWRLI